MKEKNKAKAMSAASASSPTSSSVAGVVGAGVMDQREKVWVEDRGMDRWAGGQLGE